MLKKWAAFACLLIFILSLAGCETVKGAFLGGSEGAKKDWEAAKKTDDWMRENLW